MSRATLLLNGLWIWVILSSCKTDKINEAPQNAIMVGALLPFSGEQAAVGFNMEQAVSLAIADVNAAGGVNGRPLYLVSRDSNSGSDAGYKQVKSMIYNQKIIYLLGPEENSLAKKLVPDIKKLDILNILPGFAAPVIRETGARGGWLRLAPQPRELGCAMALQAAADGYKTSAAIIAADDYQTQVASEFTTFFSKSGGRPLGSMTVKPDSDNFQQQVEALKSLDADVALLMAYPTTASQVLQEWGVLGRKIHWYFPPTLYTEMFLQNVPVDVVNSNIVFSPAGSLKDECEAQGGGDTDMDDTETAGAEADGGDVDAGNIDTGSDDSTLNVQYNECGKDNFHMFSSHYTDYWGGDAPLPAALFYYDAVLLLALGLTAAAADDHANPTPTELRAYIRQIAEAPGETISWSKIADGFEMISKGQDISYLGAAAQYQFDGENGKLGYGLAQHRLVDIWSVDNTKFISKATVGLTCPWLNYYE
jgi:ABC-type branched-subunit amino acid transport system substrate-binding protein